MNSMQLEPQDAPVSYNGVKAFLRSVQNKISSSPSSYLFYAFIIPVALMYLIYLSMGIHPFGDGSVLVLDLNGQYVYFFESLRNAIYGEGSFLYSFFRALGGEYLGMYAYYLASPLSYIVALFPQNRILEALLTIILLKTGLCGFTFGFYLHKNSKYPNKIIVVAFSVMYALCSFAVVHQNNIMWIDAIFWLPILTYSIEQLIKNKKYKLFVISLAMTMISNYYIGYMACIYSVVYFFYYYTANTKQIRNPHNEFKHGIRSFFRFGIFAIIAAAISAFILLAAYYSLTFGKNEFSDPNWSLKAKFDLLDFFTKFLPGAYDTVRPEGLPFVYCGVLSLITVPIYFMTKKIPSREKIASLAFLGFFVLCFIASPLDLIWHGFQNPNWLNHRYSFMFCFILLVLGYKGFGHLRKCNEKFILAICAFIILFVSVCQKLEFETYLVSSEKLKTFETVWLTVIVTVIIFAILCLLIRTSDYKRREGITAILASIICIEIFCNALAIVVQFDDDVVYSRYSGYNNFISGLRPVVDELKEKDGSFYRMEKTMHRKYNDNMALGIRGLSNSTSTLNAKSIKFLNNMGYTSRSHLSKYLGGNPVNDSLLGIKYLIDNKDSTTLVNYYTKEFTSGNYDVYRNPYSMSLAYGVNKNINEFEFDKYNTYFEKLNGLVSSMCGSQKTMDIFKPISNFETSTVGCTVNSTSTKVTYSEATENVKGTILYSFIAEESAEYYFFTPSDNPKECTLSVNNKSLGKYLGSDTRHIFSLGWFEKGETVTVKITLLDDPLTVKTTCDYIWYIDRDAYEEAFSQLANNPQFIIDDEYTDDHITGKITTNQNDTTILTTIAYDEGWKLYVDGSETEYYITLDALIAFDIQSIGEHTVELKYSPDIYRVGIIISSIGIFTFALICGIDLVLKKTLLKNSVKQTVNEPWVLEDFDDDHNQYELLPEEQIKSKSVCRVIHTFFRKNKQKNDDDKNRGN